MSNVFVYGTLLNDEVLSIILGRACVKHSAYLRDYMRVGLVNELYPAIRPAKGCELAGALLQGLDARDLAMLDRYEGEFYSRHSVVVYLSDHSACQCAVYVFKPQYYYLLSDQPWCNQVFREKHLHDFVAMLEEGESES